MGNPPSAGAHYGDRPLDEAVSFATHIVITCNGIGGAPCGHRAIMMTAELYQLLPNCKTLRQFVGKMKCKRCGLRGWCTIKEAGRD